MHHRLRPGKMHLSLGRECANHLSHSVLITGTAASDTWFVARMLGDNYPGRPASTILAGPERVAI
jgi:hypothetical protein